MILELDATDMAEVLSAIHHRAKACHEAADLSAGNASSAIFRLQAMRLDALFRKLSGASRVVIHL